MKATYWQAIIFDFDGVLVESVDIKTLEECKQRKLIDVLIDVK